MFDWKVAVQAVGIVLVGYLFARIWLELKAKGQEQGVEVKEERKAKSERVSNKVGRPNVPYTPDLGINHRILRTNLREYQEAIPKLKKELKDLEGKLKPKSDSDIADVPWASLPEAWQMIVLKRRQLEEVHRAVNDIKGILSSA